MTKTIIKNKKKSEDLSSCLGTLKKDKETLEAEEDVKRGWKNLSKKYA